MRVQIAICTWNRARLLDRTLDQMRRVEVPTDTQVEFLIVDNASQDDTREVISHYAETLNIRSLAEDQQGHCHARNRAIAAADGDLIVWTDDDVLVDKKWIWHYVAAAKEQSEVAFWGGPILPEFVDRRPLWIKENWKRCKGCFAVRDLGETPVEFDPSTLPYGANFAVRTDVQKQFTFNTDLGRKGNLVVGDDEIELLRRILDRGYRGRWLPQAKVAHLIPAERTTEKYVGDYFYGQGRNEALRNWRNTGAPTRLRWEALTQRLLYRIKRPLWPSQVWFTHMVRASLARGKLVGLKLVKQQRMASSAT